MESSYYSSPASAAQNANKQYETSDHIDEKGSLIASNLHDDTPEYIDQDLYLWIGSHYAALPASTSSIIIPKRTFEAVGLCFRTGSRSR